MPDPTRTTHDPAPTAPRGHGTPAATARAVEAALLAAPLTPDRVAEAPRLAPEDAAALAVLRALYGRGLEVLVSATVPDRLEVSPGSALTDDDVALLRAHKPSLLALLRALSAPVQARRAVFAGQLREGRALAFRPTAYRPGVCYACGDGLPELRHGLCGLCRVAWRLAVAPDALPLLAAALDDARVLS